MSIANDQDKTENQTDENGRGHNWEPSITMNKVKKPKLHSSLKSLIFFVDCIYSLLKQVLVIALVSEEHQRVCNIVFMALLTAAIISLSLVIFCTRIYYNCLDKRKCTLTSEGDEIKKYICHGFLPSICAVAGGILYFIGDNLIEVVDPCTEAARRAASLLLFIGVLSFRLTPLFEKNIKECCSKKSKNEPKNKHNSNENADSTTPRGNTNENANSTTPSGNTNENANSTTPSGNTNENADSTTPRGNTNENANSTTPSGNTNKDADSESTTPIDTPCGIKCDPKLSEAVVKLIGIITEADGWFTAAIRVISNVCNADCKYIWLMWLLYGIFIFAVLFYCITYVFIYCRKSADCKCTCKFLMYTIAAFAVVIVIVLYLLADNQQPFDCSFQCTSFDEMNQSCKNMVIVRIVFLLISLVIYVGLMHYPVKIFFCKSYSLLSK